MKAGATAAANTPMIHAVDHDVPTDPVKLRARQIADADATIASAQAKVDRQTQHLATAGKDKKERQRAHLTGAEKALAQAIAARKELS